MIKLVVLGSGSDGNATYIDIDGKKYLVDCGFTKPATKKRLATFGRTIEELEGVIISHDHKDHVSPWLVRDNMIITDLTGTPFKSFSLSHDAACLGYTATDKDGNKVGIVSDTGVIPEEAVGELFDCAILLCETNYDVDMLARGKYPIELLERIASEQGHCRNECAAELVEMVVCDKLKYVVCMHLSRSNNHPDLARFCMESVLRGAGSKAEVLVSEQKTPTRMVSIL